MKNFNLFKMLLAIALTVFAGSSMAKSDVLLDQVHFAKGVKCASCHGNAQPREAVTMMKCVQCHNTEKLAQKTKDLQPTNPHNNRHFGTETNCTNCHHVHQKSENYCVSCHPRFDFIVP
ncbi:cytochrome c3 family protein [Shewanella dokdonensis]|uniref:Cytochrome c3 family protein n=1 Tax=Shewanella dokdonensis TaxID=712036 RepID=A0ABX8DFB9_9GAMM|nr:cytochrome c3 family protein [Shewanella dokdonensis]MCL1074977.1 cytochrome c3 family protein [Shewanella dokdonensis]QVK23410.1 cytochrome c3 family protein [Shewanella dokdonensis]